MSFREALRRHSWRYYVYGTLVLFVLLLIPAFVLGWGDPWWKPTAFAGLSGLLWTPYTLAMDVWGGVSS